MLIGRGFFAMAANSEAPIRLRVEGSSGGVQRHGVGLSRMMSANGVVERARAEVVPL